MRPRRIPSPFSLRSCRRARPRGGGLPTAGVPVGAKALSVNIAVTSPTAGGNLRLYPAGSPLPTVSAINYSADQTRANNAIATLSDDGRLTVRCAQASGTAHFILDVNGYFQ